MQNQFLPELSQVERIRVLEENAHTVEETTYQRPLTEEELAIRREQLADNCIKLNQFEDQLKTVKDDYKSKMDPLKAHNKTILQEVKTRQETIDGILYHIANHDDGTMDTYDADGFVISSRRLRPDEKQGNIFSIAK